VGKHRQLIHADHVNSGIKYPIVFALDQVSDALNVGSVFRLADAFGIERIYLIGKTPHPPDRIITKTARNTEKNVLWEYYDDTTEALRIIREKGYKIISAELTDNSTALSQYHFKTDQKICLVAGSEKNGVSQDILDNSDDVIHIPMLGINSSMNLVTALAVITYQAIMGF
jgi:tRNA G18 (ribose-2'-O)-methylase SpoU